MTDAGLQQGSRGKGNGRHYGVGGHIGMAGARRTVKPVKGKRQVTKKRGPEWTSGLKQLYDSVIEEPIPEAFKDLLAKLDDGQS